MENKIKILVLRGVVAKYINKNNLLEVYEDSIPTMRKIDEFASKEEIEQNKTERILFFKNLILNHVAKYKPHIIVPHPYLLEEEVEILKSLKVTVVIMSSTYQCFIDQLQKGAHFAFLINDREAKINEFSEWLVENQNAICMNEVHKMTFNSYTLRIRDDIAKEAQKMVNQIADLLQSVKKKTKSGWQIFCEFFTGNNK